MKNLKTDDKILIGSLVAVAGVFVYLAMKKDEQGKSKLAQLKDDILIRSRTV